MTGPNPSDALIGNALIAILLGGFLFCIVMAVREAPEPPEPPPSVYFLACATPDGALADGIVSVGRPTLADGHWTVYPFDNEQAVVIDPHELRCSAVALPAFVKS